MNSMNMQKDMTPEDEPPRSEGVQYATGEEQRAITNSSRMNERPQACWLTRKTHRTQRSCYSYTLKQKKETD